ncbi:MAG: polymerase sigma-E factor [Fibrobacteres bacterium]|nr:polymerase sigma-E factor [Fibrobacterota bacterium]
MESIGSLYRKYAAPLFWVCKRYTRNHEDAEDMVHQVFVKVQQNLAGFRNQSGIYTWMYRIAVNECIQMFRKRKFESDESVLPDFENTLTVTPEKAMEARLVLEKIMADRDPQTVEILFLLYLEGMKQEEAAAMLAISRTTLNRKLTAFKSSMERFQW